MRRHTETVSKIVEMETSSRVNISLDAGERIGGYRYLLCPAPCNGNCIHPQKAYRLATGDFAVRFWCERCHKQFDVVFEHLDGNTQVVVERLEERTQWKIPDCASSEVA